MRHVPRALLLCILAASAPTAVAQTSRNTTLLSQQHLYRGYSDVWGYTAQDGRELALIGTTDGTSIVDLSIPTQPMEIAFIAGPSSIWRDIKTHATYAYVVTEGGGGLQIVDLEASPPNLVATWDSTFTSAHNIAISDGVAYVVGAKKNSLAVGARFLSLANPIAPLEVGAFTSWYIHDCVVRSDTMFAAAINNDFLGIVDVNDKSAPAVVTTFTWPGSNAHNCDVTSDGRYVLTADEAVGGDLHIFDISDLGNVRQVSTWSANPDAIIHNVLIQGDLAYVSYYTEGVRIVDIAVPEAPVEVGFYDTFPGVSGGFNGVWGVYPYAASGVIYASDRGTGLYAIDYSNSDGAVQGTVHDVDSGSPIAAAVVQIVGGPQAVATASGFYKIYAAPGDYNVVVSSYGFEPDSTGVVLVADSAVVHDVSLQRLPSSRVGGMVTRAGDSSAIEQASLLLQGTPLLQSSDGAGTYEFAHVPHGVYTLRVSRFGFAPQARTISVTVFDPLLALTYDFELVAAASAEDFESGTAGWVSGSPQDTATGGAWVWGVPVGSGGGEVQPGTDHTVAPGAACWVSANAISETSPITSADVDGGYTTLTSPVFDVASIVNPHISYWRWFSNDRGSVPGPPDTLRVDISNNAGIDWVPVERVVESAAWTEVVFRVGDVVAPTSLMRLRFVAEDLGTESVVEVALDDVMAFDATTTDLLPGAVPTQLYPPTPNPFNPSTQVRFQLQRAGRVELLVFDVRGRVVRTLARGHLGAGVHERSWEGRSREGQLASGTYWIRLHADGGAHVRRAILLK
ncbi:MAG: choice-of-anchor B family protein [Candidatus Latescibacterota bacterium]|nr:MAG: choice-of-anchor B family protein [Candidatus Latescibacterota bacterium]